MVSGDAKNWILSKADLEFSLCIFINYMNFHTPFPLQSVKTVDVIQAGFPHKEQIMNTKKWETTSGEIMNYHTTTGMGAIKEKDASWKEPVPLRGALRPPLPPW